MGTCSTKQKHLLCQGKKQKSVAPEKFKTRDFSTQTENQLIDSKQLEFLQTRRNFHLSESIKELKSSTNFLEGTSIQTQPIIGTQFETQDEPDNDKNIDLPRLKILKGLNVLSPIKNHPLSDQKLQALQKQKTQPMKSPFKQVEPLESKINMKRATEAFYGRNMPKLSIIKKEGLNINKEIDDRIKNMEYEESLSSSSSDENSQSKSPSLSPQGVKFPIIKSLQSNLINFSNSSAIPIRSLKAVKYQTLKQDNTIQSKFPLKQSITQERALPPINSIQQIKRNSMIIVDSSSQQSKQNLDERQFGHNQKPSQDRNLIRQVRVISRQIRSQEELPGIVEESKRKNIQKFIKRQTMIIQDIKKSDLVAKKRNSLQIEVIKLEQSRSNVDFFQPSAHNLNDINTISPILKKDKSDLFSQLQQLQNTQELEIVSEISSTFSEIDSINEKEQENSSTAKKEKRIPLQNKQLRILPVNMRQRVSIQYDLLPRQNLIEQKNSNLLGVTLQQKRRRTVGFSQIPHQIQYSPTSSAKQLRKQIDNIKDDEKQSSDTESIPSSIQKSNSQSRGKVSRIDLVHNSSISSHQFKSNISRSSYSRSSKGKKILNYRQIKNLGEGKFSKVKLCQSIEDSENVVAIKILNIRKLKRRDQVSPLMRNSTSDITNEIRVLKKLNHQNIIKLIETQLIEDKQYIVLEYCDQDCLQSILEKKTYIEEEKARQIFKQIIEGLEYLQTNGICHRDLKPHNIGLCENDVVKIFDFGTCVTDLPIDNPKVSGLGGTLLFNSPEQLDGERKSYDGFKADIWACGVILYQILTGKYPFYEATTHLITKTILNSEVQYPIDIKQQISDSAKDLISLILEKDPQKRLSINQIKSHKWFCQ
ncbi:cbl-interacting protein kinase 04 [Stylonychia lemnae]|uniref:Cbl-interacting protein kinase 04 n=1 Tax=Stylonychia lemnae TaxID=5949 RepID=A0A077ZPG2_STYLE|nr:cbl-interacting protein kinase 04 [Stylonychia lemnae]|eukprot:CDW71324.1 cbl-interacting protein kinase 04 [Stylonychia lemnae]